ncbi:hypothetical protein J6590_056763 [Homalodisca vitripennis]|nr:hypothetical protein J6590_056763 [Homalodisca vitripennis]
MKYPQIEDRLPQAGDVYNPYFVYPPRPHPAYRLETRRAHKKPPFVEPTANINSFFQLIHRGSGQGKIKYTDDIFAGIHEITGSLHLTKIGAELRISLCKLFRPQDANRISPCNVLENSAPKHLCGRLNAPHQQERQQIVISHWF